MNRNYFSFPKAIATFSVATATLLITTAFVSAQAPTKILGTLASASGNAITVRTDGGAPQSITVSEQTVYKRISPGQKDLSTADAITLSDLTIGDRILVNLDPAATTPSALRIIAIKQQDLAQQQQKVNEEWQKNGVGGLVKTLDAASNMIQISSGTGANAKTITIHTSASTVLKRYAPASVNYAQSGVAPFAAIKLGDQLRARGTKSNDGSELTALEVISGTFLNLSGKLDAIDAASATISFKDLATKKSVTAAIPAEAQLRQIPDNIANMLATRLKSTAASPAPIAGTQSQGGNSNSTRDMVQMLTKAPQIKLADLKKGDVVMIVATDDGTKISVITLLSGVDALLQAPASRDLLSNWSVSGGGESAGGGQ